jgi:hypothetical protein
LDANPDPIFHINANSDLDPNPSFTNFGKSEKKLLNFIHSIAILFLVNVKGVIILQYFGQLTEKKYRYRFLYIWLVEMDTDPGPDPTK